MRFAEIVLMSLTRKISSMMAEYFASNSTGRGSAMLRQYMCCQKRHLGCLLTGHVCEKASVQSTWDTGYRNTGAECGPRHFTTPRAPGVRLL